MYEPTIQPTYKIDNIPSYKYGEWEGIKPSHWVSSLRVFRPTFTTGLFRESPPPKLSIRKIPQKNSTEMTFRPAKTILPQRESLTNPPESDSKRKIGLKRVNIKFTEGKSRDEKRHFTPRFGYEKIPEPPFQIKTFSPDGNYCTDKEISIEKELGGKMRIWNLIQQRNGFLMKNPGDKNYKTSEYLPGFFLDGGLIVGSTNRINQRKNHSKKANDFYDTINLNVNVLNKDKLWKSKEKKDVLDFDSDYVRKTISSWEENILKEFQPDYFKKKEEEKKK